MFHFQMHLKFLERIKLFFSTETTRKEIHLSMNSVHVPLQIPLESETSVFAVVTSVRLTFLVNFIGVSYQSTFGCVQFRTELTCPHLLAGNFMLPLSVFFHDIRVLKCHVAVLAHPGSEIKMCPGHVFHQRCLCRKLSIAVALGAWHGLCLLMHQSLMFQQVTFHHEGFVALVAVDVSGWIRGVERHLVMK
jgi:hypothetical protein